MTGALGVVSGVIRAGALAQGIGQSARNLAGLLNGGSAGVGLTPLPGGVNIGGVDLQAFEIPETMPWGADEELKEHRLPGGAKVFQLMGAAYTAITWSGAMIGPDAVDRALLLEQLVFAEQVTTLAFGSIQYDIIVRKFEAEYRSPYWMGKYELSCEVLPDARPDGDPVDDPGQQPSIPAAQSGVASCLKDVASGLSIAAADAQNLLSMGQAALGSAASVILPITNAVGVQVPYAFAAQSLLTTANVSLGGLGGPSAGAAAIGATSASLGSVASMTTAGMQVSGGALTIAAANAPAGDLLNVSDFQGAIGAAGMQANLVSMGYATAFAQDQIPATAATLLPPTPSVGWTPASSLAGLTALNLQYAQ